MNAKRPVGLLIGLTSVISLSFCRLPSDDITKNYPVPGYPYVLNITILITLTIGGALPTDLGRSGAAIEMAIREARKNIVPNVNLHYEIITSPGMSVCPDEENHATYLITSYAFEKVTDTGIPPVGLLLGPACSVATQHAGRVAADMDLPLINSQATSDYFDDRVVFKTLTRLAYTMITLDEFALRVLDALNYTSDAIIYDEVMPWSQVTGQVFQRALYYRPPPAPHMNSRAFPYKPTDKVDMRQKLMDASTESRVIIVMAPAAVTRQWMLTAFDMGMCNGDYVFITYEWFRSPYFGEYTWQYYDNRDADARAAYRVLLKIASTEYWTDPVFMKWSEEVKLLADQRFGYTYGPNETVAPAVTGMHDGVILYAIALNETLAAGQDPFNGTLITKRMWGKTIPSPEGKLKVRSIGVKDQSFSLMQVDDVTGNWVAVMDYDGVTGVFRPNVRPIKWINGKQLPANEPECGFQNDKPECLLRASRMTSLIIAIAGAGVLVIIIVCVIIFIINRKRKFEQSLQDDWWKVSFQNVKIRMKGEGSSMSVNSHNSRNSGNKASMLSSTDSENEPKTLNVGRYEGKLVFVKAITARIVVSREFLVWVNKLRALNHENLNRLVGVCTEFDHESILTDYCVKNSLSDLVQNDSVNLDWSFKFSLISDMVTGMEFMHASFVHSFGYLHSSNCVIDGRFVLKITDYHLPMLRSKNYALNAHPQTEDVNYKTLLWRAPEHLRSPMPSAGTQKGDVYSAGIVLQEITARSDPYFDSESTMTYEEIVNRVAVTEKPPFRPKIVGEGVPREILQIAEWCWKEVPEERPTFHGIRLALKASKYMKEGNIMDNLLKRMEKYAQDLEALVAERTSEFFDEKRKAEELLYQVMPKAIADVLKVGGYFPPEAFDSVTVYFSDIVGYITLSSQSTPFETVAFLNDVYTLFDDLIGLFDAYKVETISDTYMVASGLPMRNGNRHASEIARMSLKFLEEAVGFRIQHRPDMKLKLRIGINSGPCAAGIVGLKMPRYCLFGDTVNTASRMESTGEGLKIHINDTTKALLDQFEGFETELRGEIEVKGKGKHTTYWLTKYNGPPLGRRTSTIPSEYPVPKQFGSSKKGSLLKT